MNIIFFGTSDYCIPVLEALHKNFELKLVVTRPDRPVGRKGILTPSATKVWAMNNNIPVATPETLKKGTEDRVELIKLLKLIKPDTAVVSDYGLIIPEEIFNLPKFGTINIHFSKLPDLRGPSPVQFTLLRGDKDAWITIFKLENPPELEIKMDSGPILFQQPYPILPDDTTASLYARLFTEAAKILPENLKSYFLNPKSLTSQDHSKATFSKMLSREDGYVEWDYLEKEPINTYRKYQAMSPWPGLWSIYNNKRIKILKCHLGGGQPKAGAPWVQKLVLDEVQYEGKNPISWSNVSSHPQ